jgi:hypothetical protein
MNKKMSKAAKVRRMLAKGYTTEQITAKLKASKQYVYDIKSKEKYRAVGTPVKKEKTDEKPITTSNDIQVGGVHYKELDPQPWDVIQSWGMGFLSGNVIKYLARYESKNGIEDLQKARHYLDKLIETVK